MSTITVMKDNKTFNKL